MKIQKNFVDALAGLTIRGGVVRLDFGEVAVAHTEKKEGDKEAPSRFETVHRLYIPVSGFVQTFQAMRKMMERIEEEVKKQHALKPEEGLSIDSIKGSPPTPTKN